MALHYYLRRVVCLLLIYIMGASVAYANYSWQNFETLLENGQHAAAIEQLDKHLNNSHAKHDDREWTLALLRGARTRALVYQQASAINYLIYKPWPTDHLPQSILNLALAREYEAYFNESNKPYLLTNSSQGQHSKALSSAQLTDKINHHYELAVAIAQKNNLTTLQAQDYLTQGGFPSTVRANLSDVIVAYWQQFLVNKQHWSSEQRKQLNTLAFSDLLDLEASTASKTEHPLFKVKLLSQQLIREHQKLGNAEEVFEVKRYYVQLLTHLFLSDKNIIQISEFLSKQLRQLGSHYPWWTMGQFQLANLQRKLRQKKSLTHIHDLAVQGSIIHPESLGAIKNRDLINQLELSEYMVTGKKTSDLNDQSIEIEFRNLQKLYFRAWRATKPLPAHLDDELKETTINALLAKKPDNVWVVELPDKFDLRQQTIQHSPQIKQYGQWLIVASINEDFLGARAELQLLSMQFSRFIASVSYNNKKFIVAVYQAENGLPATNVSVDLMKVDNDIQTTLSSVKTDRKGNAVLLRHIDAEHFRILVHQGDDSAFIDIPVLLSLADEAFWSTRKRQAKSLLMTDKDIYIKGDTIYWSLISRKTATKNAISLSANANKNAWLRLFDQNNILLLERTYTTDSGGSASGGINLTLENFPKLFAKKIVDVQSHRLKQLRIESSWGGEKLITVALKSDQKSTQRKPKAFIQLSHLDESYNADELLSIKGHAEGCRPLNSVHNIHWLLLRTSTKSNGQLHSSQVIDRGGASTDHANRFHFQTKLTLGEDKTHQLRHSFSLIVKCSDESTLSASYTKRLLLKDKKSYYSVLNDRNFIVEGESSSLHLLQQDVRSSPLSGKSKWFIYKRLPSKAAENSINKSSCSSPSWMLGSVKQSGVISHNAQGKASLDLKHMESGIYRLRVIPKDNPDQAAYEYDFIIAAASVSKGLSLTGVLLTEKKVLEANNHTLRFIAGSGNKQQWSRLTITHDSKQLASQMLSPGIHLLTFPITEAHQGGINFLLEWVEDNRIAHREIQIEVPWISKRVSLSVSKSKEAGLSGWRLTTMDSKGRSLSKPTKSKVLLYFTEKLESTAVPKPVNLDSLYWQSTASLMRLNSNGRSYPHYFTPKHFPKQLSDVVELPAIRYDVGTDTLLNSERSVFTISPLSSASGANHSANFDILLAGNSGGISEAGLASSKVNPLMHNNPLTHFAESFLDADGGLNIEIPQKFTGKQVHLRAIVTTPDLKTGQLSVILR